MNYKFIQTILFLFIISCSSNDDLKVDVDSFMKQGDQLDLSSNDNLLYKEVNKLDKIPNDTYKNNFLDKDLNLKKQVQYQKKKIQTFVLNNKNIIAITYKSEIILYNQDLKKIKSKVIYDKKTQKNYELKFSIKVYKNILLLADNIGNLHAINLDNLTIIWSKKLIIPFRSNIALYKNNMYVINSNSKVFSINVENGNINWSFETSSKNLKHPSSYQIKTFKDDLFFTNDSGEIYSINLFDNKIKWSLVFQGQKYKQLPPTFYASQIGIDGNDLFISTNYGFLYSINMNKGYVNWSMPLKLLNRFEFINNLLISNTDHGLVVLDKNNGSILFNNNLNKILNTKKNDIKIIDFILGTKNINLITNNSLIAKIDRDNLNIVKIDKFLNYKNYHVQDKNLYILSKNSIYRF